MRDSAIRYGLAAILFLSAGRAGWSQEPAPDKNPFRAAPAESKSSNPFSADSKPKPKPRPPVKDDAPPEETPEKPVEPAPEKPVEPTPEQPQPEEAAGLRGGVHPDTPWKVTADKASFTPLANARFSITVPGLLPNADPRWERARMRILFPHLPAAIVGVGLNEKDSDAREVWDIENNRKIGSVSKLGLEGSKLMGLSPDGKFFAAKPQFDDLIALVDVAAGKTIKTLAIADQRPDLVAFSSPTQLLVAENGRVLKFSIPDAKPQGEIKVANWQVRDGWQLSPGGKYFAAVRREGNERNRLSIFEIATGELAGELILTAGAGDCAGVAFSFDGRALAAVVDTDTELLLEVFDLTTPAVTVEAPIERTAVEEIDSYQGPFLEWLPGGTRLLIGGKSVVDAATGKIQETLAVAGSYAVRPLSERAYAAVSQTKFVSHGFGDIEEPVVVDTVPSESPTSPAPPTAPVETSAGPPLTSADRSGIRQVNVGATTRWDVRLEAPPAYKDKLITTPVKVPGGFVQQVLLSSIDPPLAVVSYSSGPLGSRGSQGVTTWAETFDLQSGQGRNTVKFPLQAVAMGVTADGARVATVGADGLGRIDVWSLQDDRHIVGFRPASGASDDLTPWFVDFVNAEHLIVAVADELTLWKVPDCKALYSLKIGDLRPAMSPSRDHVAVSIPGDPRLLIVETLTGEVRGSVSTSGMEGERLASAAFHHRGRWLACLTGDSSGGELVVVETAGGDSTVRTRLPVSGKVIQWCGDDYVLIDGAQLVSLTSESLAWSYDMTMGIHCRESIDGRHWYLTAVSPNDKSYALFGATLPEDSSLRKISTSTSPKKVLFKPGDPVRLNVIADGAGPKSAAGQIMESLTKRYAKAGSAATADAKAVLKVQPYVPTALRPVRKPPATTLGGAAQGHGPLSDIDLLNRSAGAAPPKEAEPVPTVPLSNVWELSLSVGDDMLWQTWLAADPTEVTLLAREQDAASRRDEDLQAIRMAVAGLLALEPPKYAFSPGASEGAGRSLLSTSGPRKP